MLTSNKAFLADFGKRVKERRVALGMTQQELAERVGYKNRQSISYLESGRNDIDTDQLKMLAENLNCSVDYLMGWTIEDEETRLILEIKSATATMNAKQLERLVRYAELINRGDL